MRRLKFTQVINMSLRACLFKQHLDTYSCAICSYLGLTSAAKQLSVIQLTFVWKSFSVVVVIKGVNTEAELKPVHLKFPEQGLTVMASLLTPRLLTGFYLTDLQRMSIMEKFHIRVFVENGI